MMEYFKNLNLIYKLLVTILFISSITLASMSVIGYLEGKRNLTDKQFEILNIIAENKKREIENYFLGVKNQITTLAESPSTIQAALDFEKNFNSLDKMEYPVKEINNGITDYYTADFIPKLNFNSLKTENISSYTPNETKRILLQHDYIYKNPNPNEFKYLMYLANNNLDYDRTHQLYHKAWVNYLQKFMLEDIYLLDLKGNIVYSVRKKVDFATNLLSGPFRNSNAGKLFRRIIKSKEGQVVAYEDYDHYAPSYYIPYSFVATPIYAKNKKIGVLMFQLTNEKISDILSNNQQWEKAGLGGTGEIALIAPDFKLRNNTRRFLTDPLSYVTDLKASLKRGTIDEQTIEYIKKLNTTIFLRRYKTDGVINALNGISGRKYETDFRGTGVLDVYGPVDVFGVKWAMVTEIDNQEIFAIINTYRNRMLLVSAILLLVSFALAFYLSNSISRPLQKIQREISMLAQGIFPHPSAKIYKDELGKIDLALNNLISNMKQVANFAENIGKENFDTHFDAKGEQDILGNSLLKMRDSLKGISQEEKQRDWVNTGSALFGQLLRIYSSDLDKLAEKSITELVKYLKAKQGAFFLYDENEKALRLISSYAYEKPRFKQKNILPGEGLVGQAYLEKEKIYLTRIPDDYTSISSGLGFAKPKNLLVVPVKFGGEVLGVIEIATLEELKTYEVEFVENMAEDIATTISTIFANNETKHLLKETQLVAEQLRLQEEEMRKNFEELMASQEEMRIRQKQLDMILSENLGKLDEIDLQDKKKEESLLDKKVKDAILRQKNLLDKAFDTNQEKEKDLKESVEKWTNSNANHVNN